MATTELTPPEHFGEHGEPCVSCGAALADDQRYCLNCGHRRAGERVPYAELLAGREAHDVFAEELPPEEPPRRRWHPGLLAGGGALAGVLLLALGVALGLLIKGDQEPRIVERTIASKPPDIIVNAGGGGEAGETTGVSDFTSDWPEGKSGHTVQLSTLPNTSPSSDVDTAKSEAETNGAADVGALDSDEYTSLESGNYVIYSGVFTGKGSKKKAQAEVKKLKKDFPDAKVVAVSSGDEEFGVADTKPEEKVQEVDKSVLEDLENSTGEEQQKKSAKLPDTIGTGGKPPPKDNKAPGGGSGGGVTIP